LTDGTQTDPNEDPGWRPALPSVFLTFVPYWRHRLGKGNRSSDGLLLLRKVFVSMAAGLLAIGLVVVVVELTGGLERSMDDGPVTLAVAGFGLASFVGGALRPRLDCADGAQLAKSYAQRFFLRVAVAEAAALIGFVGFVLTTSGWLYFLGALFSAVGFARAAPTARHLAQDEQRLAASGCARSVVAALRRSPPGSLLSPRRVRSPRRRRRPTRRRRPPPAVAFAPARPSTGRDRRTGHSPRP